MKKTAILFTATLFILSVFFSSTVFAAEDYDTDEDVTIKPFSERVLEKDKDRGDDADLEESGRIETESTDVQSLSHFGATEFIGTAVIGKNDKDVGTVREIIFDQTGHASYLFLSRTEEGGLIPIPFEEVNIVEREGQDVFSVSFDEEMIADAPTFNSIEDFEQEPSNRVDVRAYYDKE